jgi:hypothetical protein
LRLPAADAGVLRFRVLRPTSTSSAGTKVKTGAGTIGQHSRRQ